MSKQRVGVVLFQLGGPDSAEAVRPFLYNLFCDPEIIDFPLASIARKPLAWWIARKRWEKVASHYAAIGGQSPLRLLTERQARALEAALRPSLDPCVVVAMRYWNPDTAAAVAQLEAAGPEETVLLPLYPQYSRATTRSSVNEWRRICAESGSKVASVPARTIESFHNHPLYLEAVVEKINLSLTHFDAPAKVHLVFSAHGVPVSFIEGGDPYQRQVEETVQLVCHRGGWTNAHTLCYQSKFGKQKWLEPSLDDTIHRLAAEQCRHLLVIPISFVSEHIETLHEINIETREEALNLGIEQFEMMPALNDSPKFIACLNALVLEALGQARQGTAA